MWSQTRPGTGSGRSGGPVASLDLDGAPATFGSAELWFRGVPKTETSFEIRVTLQRGGERAPGGSLFTYGEGPSRDHAPVGSPAPSTERMNLRLDVSRAWRALAGRRGNLEIILSYVDQ